MRPLNQGLTGNYVASIRACRGPADRYDVRPRILLPGGRAPNDKGAIATEHGHRNDGRKVIGLIQRVSSAEVTVDAVSRGSIGRGLLVFVAVEPGDTSTTVARLARRVLNYRVFPDAQERMNLSLLDEGLGLLAVPQFTLAADTARGNRPGFSNAAAPDIAKRYFEQYLTECHKLGATVESGVFGASMEVSLINDGPVTFWLEA